jgi:hypothetical protein
MADSGHSAAVLFKGIIYFTFGGQIRTSALFREGSQKKSVRR